MYTPVATGVEGLSRPIAPIHSSSMFMTTCWENKIIWKLAFVVVLGASLLFTYDTCVSCVVGIAVVSLLTVNCLPGASVVFIASVCVLMYHAIDMRSASIRVQIPLNDVVRLPTYQQLQDDFQSYVHLDRPLPPPSTTPSSLIAPPTFVAMPASRRRTRA